MMIEVENFNSYKKCCEKFCDTDYTHFENIFINGFDISLPLCKEHAEEWEDRFSEEAKTLHDIKIKLLEEKKEVELAAQIPAY